MIFLMHLSAKNNAYITPVHQTNLTVSMPVHQKNSYPPVQPKIILTECSPQYCRKLFHATKFFYATPVHHKNCYTATFFCNTGISFLWITKKYQQVSDNKNIVTI